MITIGQIATPQDCAAVKALVLDFVAWADTQDPDAAVAPTFRNLEAELDGLPGIYGPPTGCFLLARNDGQPAGCVAFRPIDVDTVELKRMYVRPDQRGNGIGLALVRALLDVARAQGRQKVVLDSYHTMTGAHAIYRSVGFRDVEPPADFPAHFLGRVVFMELPLTT
jgi:GNAT superfamily N-acetyltransferase